MTEYLFNSWGNSDTIEGSSSRAVISIRTLLAVPIMSISRLLTGIAALLLFTDIASFASNIRLEYLLEFDDEGISELGPLLLPPGLPVSDDPPPSSTEKFIARLAVFALLLRSLHLT